MLRSTQALTTALLVLLLFTAAQAQDEAAEEPVIRRYTVEMVIFKYLQEVSTGSEIFPADRPVFEPPLLDAAPVIPPELPQEQEAPKPIGDPGLALLSGDQYTMRDILRRLELLEVYDPLLHFGWTQATWPADQTRPIELGTMAALPDGLDGKLTLYLGRYLHLEVDLTLEAAPPAFGGRASYDRAETYGDQRAADDLAEIEAPGPVRYRINEDRILRNGELRYFDHPKFGVLAKVTRVEEDEEDESDPDPI